MKATFTINQLQFELEGAEARELFQMVAQIQDIFEAETQCGCCQSDNIRYGFRDYNGDKFYELVCRECSAQFRFGQKKIDNSLFPKRKAEDGKPLPNHGWSKWEPRDSDDTRSAPRARIDVSDHRPASRPAANTGKSIPEYADWDAAEKDVNFGRAILKVDGILYHVPAGKREYVEAPQRAQSN